MEDVLIAPTATEKTMIQSQTENKLTFIVNRKATKKQIKEDVERQFSVKVEKINVLYTKRGKKAVIKLSGDFNAEEIGERIGIY
ncbi:MAG: 50S ribosomal protein L23 [Cuniculiplasma sp.]